MPDSRLQAEYDALNAQIKTLIDQRTEWVAANASAFARWPVGTDVFDLMSGAYVGTVTAHDRGASDASQLNVLCRVTGANGVELVAEVSTTATVTFGSVAERKTWLTAELASADQKAADSKRADTPTVIADEAPSLNANARANR